MLSATEDAVFLTRIEIFSGKHAVIFMLVISTPTFISSSTLPSSHMAVYTWVSSSYECVQRLLWQRLGCKKPPFGISNTSYFVKCTVVRQITNTEFCNKALRNATVRENSSSLPGEWPRMDL